MEKQQLVADRFKLLKIIGRGGFGDVYMCEDTHGKLTQPIVTKIEKVANQDDATLVYEAKIIEYLKEIPTVPNIYSYGSERGYSYSVMDNCGIPISAIQKITNNKFDAKVRVCNCRLSWSSD